MGRLEDEVERIRDGREMTPFDESVLEAVAGLLLRLQDARARIADEGTIIEDSHGFPVEHPALAIEKRASAEVRGWVDKRPDLFGAPKRKSAARGGGFPGLPDGGGFPPAGLKAV